MGRRRSAGSAPRRGRRPPQRARGVHAARGGPAARARAGRGALPGRDARGLPGADRHPARLGRLVGARDRRGRRQDLLRRARRSRARARAAAPDALERRRAGGRGHARLPLVGRRRRGRDGRGAAGRRRAVQLVDRVRRGADPQGLPPRRARRQPRAGAAALPVRARVPPHRPDRRLVPVRRAADGRHARRAAGVPGRRDRRLGPRARRARVGPRGVPRPRARARRGVGRAALGARLGGVDPAFAPEEPSTEAIAILTATIDEEIERIFVELPDDRRSTRSAAAARTSRSACRCSRASAPAGA